MSKIVKKRNKKYKPILLTTRKVISQELKIDIFFDEIILKELDSINSIIF